MLLCCCGGCVCNRAHPLRGRLQTHHRMTDQYFSTHAEYASDHADRPTTENATPQAQPRGSHQRCAAWRRPSTPWRMQCLPFTDAMCLDNAAGAAWRRPSMPWRGCSIRRSTRRASADRCSSPTTVRIGAPCKSAHCSHLHIGCRSRTPCCTCLPVWKSRLPCQAAFKGRVGAAGCPAAMHPEIMRSMSTCNKLRTPSHRRGGVQGAGGGHGLPRGGAGQRQGHVPRDACTVLG